MSRPKHFVRLVLLVALCAPAALGRQLSALLSDSNNKVTDGLPGLIPLKLLLGNSKQRNPQLSPDGKMLGYAAPSADGVMNVWIKKLPDAAELQKLQHNVSLFENPGNKADKQVTFDKRRGITAYSWSDAGDAIFYIQDKDGDENYHLYYVPLKGLFAGTDKKPQAIDLTPFPGVRASGIVGDKRHPDKLYIGLNKRDPEVFDMYKLDVPSRRLVLDTINPGDASTWLMDYDFNIKGVSSYNNSDGATFIRVREEKPTASSSTNNAGSKLRGLDVKELFKEASKQNLTDAEWIAASTSGSNVSAWRILVNWPFGEDSGVFRFNKKGDGIYVVDSTGRDTTEFQLISTAPGAKVLKRYASNPLSNVGGVMFEPDTWEPQGASFNYHKTQWTLFDSNFEAEWKKVQSLYPQAVLGIADRSHDQQTWLLSYSFDNRTTAYYVYRRGSWPPQLLMEVQPDLNKYVLAPMHSVVITARDGLKLPGYLTLPVKPGVPLQLPESITGKIPDLRQPVSSSSSSKDPAVAAEKAGQGAAKLDLDLPMVLLVHGGPWSRDSWGADAVVQWLANRGYAVLQVNYRGSSDFGKSFLNAGNKQWGTGAMQHDLTDAVKWAVDKGIADPKKVCIMGASYGGYATLAGLTFTPELYACGVDLVGVSNIATFQKSIPAYWKPMRYELSMRVGDAEKDPSFNRAISPYYHVDNIKVPLIIGQGANDVRVPQRESDQMYRAMKKHGLDVTYILYSDEGHGLVRPDNRLDYYSRVDQFLAKHLGGRSEPLIKMPGTTAKVMSN